MEAQADVMYINTWKKGPADTTADTTIEKVPRPSIALPVCTG